MKVSRSYNYSHFQLLNVSFPAKTSTTMHRFLLPNRHKWICCLVCDCVFLFGIMSMLDKVMRLEPHDTGLCALDYNNFQALEIENHNNFLLLWPVSGQTSGSCIYEASHSTDPTNSPKNAKELVDNYNYVKLMVRYYVLN